MPAILTHYIFAKQVIRDEDKYSSLYYLGAQGPDVFFYYGYSLGRRTSKNRVREFGTFLHHTDIAPIYNFFIQYALKQSPDEKDMLLDYIRGLFVHYCLDRSCHPYIFYKSGFSTDPRMKYHYAYTHAMMESYIDVLVANYYHQPKNNVAAIRIKRKQVKLVSNMYQALNTSMLKNPSINAKTFYQSYKDMKFTQQCFYSPFKVKRLIGFMFFRRTMFYAMTYPAILTAVKNYDFLNLSHAGYLDCVDGKNLSLSFIDMMDNAKKSLDSVDYFIGKARHGGAVLDDILKFTNGIDHDGGKLGSIKRYSAYIFDTWSLFLQQ